MTDNTTPDVAAKPADNAESDAKAGPAFDAKPHRPVLPEIPLNELLRTVREAYSEQLAEALRAELAFVASLSYADISCCLALILEGPSGTGKSTLIQMLNPDVHNQKYLRREDRFTAAAFVSNASNVSKDKLKEIDLLPKITNKVMLTKELASMFGSDDKALREIFGVVTAVLDGKGYRTATGTHGERGYEGDLRFNWIGATTPIPTRIHSIMAGFGCRFLFYECRFPELDREEMLKRMKTLSSYAMQAKCTELVNTFISQHFDRYGVKTIHTADIETSDDIMNVLYDYAKLMTLGRRAVSCERNSSSLNQPEETRFYASEPEALYRPIEMFRSIAIGSALIAKRKTITADDLTIVKHIAFSSIPDTRRRLLRCLIRAGGQMTSTDATEKLGCSRPTALKWMRELATTELCEFHSNGSGSTQPDFITLHEEFQFLVRQHRKSS